MKKLQLAKCRLCRDAGFYQYPYQCQPYAEKTWKYCQCPTGTKAQKQKILEKK